MSKTGTIVVELMRDGVVAKTWQIPEEAGVIAGGELRVVWMPPVSEEEETLVPTRSPYVPPADDSPTLVERDEPTVGDRTVSGISADEPTQVETDAANLERLRARARTEARASRFAEPLEPRKRPEPNAAAEELPPPAIRKLTPADTDDIRLTTEEMELDLDE